MAELDSLVTLAVDADPGVRAADPERLRRRYMRLSGRLPSRKRGMKKQSQGIYAMLPIDSLRWGIRSRASTLSACFFAAFSLSWPSFEVGCAR
jgi:hypothetical protein